MYKIQTLIALIIICLSPFENSAQLSVFFSDSIRARELNREAVNYGRDGMQLQALNTFLESLELRKRLYGEEDYSLGAVYMGIGITYRTLGQLDMALKYFDMAEKNYLLRSDFRSDPRINLYLNIGNVYRSKLDYLKALQYFEQALLLYNKEDIVLPELGAGIKYNIAEIYYVLNDYDKALSIIKSNIDYAYAEDQILFYELQAFIYQIRGNAKSARKNFVKAIELTKYLNSENHINVAIAYLNYATFQVANKQFQDAGASLELAHDIMEVNQPVGGQLLADYYRTLGYFSIFKPVASDNLLAFKKQKIKNVNIAIDWYKKALAALNFPADYSLETFDVAGGWLSLMDCIALLKFIGDGYMEITEYVDDAESPTYKQSLVEAIETYQIVGSLVQRARKEISSDESRIQLTSLEYATFQKMVAACYTAYSMTKDFHYVQLAFQNAERIKGSSVFDKLSDNLALENSLVPDSLLQLERTLNSTVAIYSEKLYEETGKSYPDSTLVNTYNSQIFAATKHREELNRYMETEYPDYYDLKYSGSMLTIEEIQNELHEKDIILEYVLIENDSLTELYTFVIAQDLLDFRKLKTTKDFVPQVETMFYFMSNSNYMMTTNDDSKQFCLAAHQLHETLVKPFDDVTTDKNITIVPDGKLSYIPFDALLKSLPDTSSTIQFNKLDYLIYDHIINYSNSSNLLFKNKKKRKLRLSRTLAFAPDYNRESFEMLEKEMFLLPLPGVKKEVKRIANNVETRIFEGKDATEHNFRKYAEKYDILHLAMHAFINDSLPAFSRLAFTQTVSDDEKADGWLNTIDIYNLHLNANMTVLSACNTGFGQLRKGEGLMSLARGFMYAGCPSIVMSLWEVEDESGTQIMENFYKALRKGRNKDEALRMAKLDYLEKSNSRRAHPHYWLGFVSIGENSPLYGSYDIYFFVLLIVALTVVGTDQFIRIKKARKKRAL